MRHFFGGDTIVAVSTPPGRGGIGVVRVSGAEARAIAAPLLALSSPLVAGRARFARIVDPGVVDANGAAATIDEAVVTFFAAPHSATGEDVVEISTHGSPVILEYVVRSAVRNGARLARPGEFTERAFLSGRLDLTQAEAVHDLVAASTLYQARTAATQLGGSVARALAPAKERLVRLIVQMEGGIDFAEDDIDLLGDETIRAEAGAVRVALEALERTFGYGRIVREGATMAIVGRPNAGKSSLFNALLERERAIVTSAPGTTRDLVTERLAIEGIPIELTDTAGLREASDEAERMGIARSRESLAEASLVLLVVDATMPLDAEDRAVLEGHGGRPLLVARNKVDLLEAEALAALPAGVTVVATSARTGAGIQELRRAIRGALTAEPEGGTSGAMLTSVRQHAAIAEAIAALAAAERGVAEGLPHEMLLLDLHAALGALGELTGVTTTEDLLRLIFSTFCIGK